MLNSHCKSTPAFITFSVEPSCHDIRWIRLTIRLRQNKSRHHLRQTLRNSYKTQEKITCQMNYFQPNTKWIRSNKRDFRTLLTWWTRSDFFGWFPGLPSKNRQPNCPAKPCQHGAPVNRPWEMFPNAWNWLWLMINSAMKHTPTESYIFQNNKY